MRKLPNCILEEHDGNQVVLCAMKTIPTWELLLINYDLNRIDASTATMGVLMFHCSHI
jgi:hypothetical protein